MKEKIIISNIKAGFGNQLFQYATGLSAAIKTGSEFKLDLSFYEDGNHNVPFRLGYLNLTFEIASNEEIIWLKNLKRRSSIYTRLIKKAGIRNSYNKITNVIDTPAFKPSKKILKIKSPSYIEGWCVKETYFNDIKETLFRIFSPNFEFSKIAQDYQDEIIKTNSVSMHIRRGDYLKNNFYEILPISYYTKSIDIVSQYVEDLEIFVFSDDIEWCHNNLKVNKKLNFVRLDEGAKDNGLHDIEEFFLMSACKNNIIANSSYSWWAAYLNKNKKSLVIAPQRWYTDTFYQNSLEKHSFIPENWTII